MNKGIDYGLGSTNIDKATGIRYGVISQNEVLQAWADSSEAYYGDPHCPRCGHEAKEAKGEYAKYEHAKYECAEYVCHNCKYAFGGESAYGESPLSWYYDQEGYMAECGEDGDIFLTKSPFFTRAAFCSPCAPGACYLTSPCEDGEKAYCFGHDWFEGGKAPYPVYSVATGELVQPETKPVTIPDSAMFEG